MWPVLFRIPYINYDVPAYGAMLMVGFLLSAIWAAHRAVKSHGNPDVVLNCAFLALLGGVGGARLMYVIHYWDEHFANAGGPWAVFRAVIDVRRGGLEVYGGVIAVCLLVVFYLWRSKHSLRWYFDIMAPSCALGMGIGRIGCFLNGCCFGGVCQDLPFAVRFPFASPAQMQQYLDHVPGSELPPELVLEPGDGALPADARPIGLPRETMLLSDAQLAAAGTAWEEWRGRRNELAAAITATSDARERARLEAELRAAEQRAERALPYGGCTPAISVKIAAHQLSKHDLTPAELRQVAAQHRSLPVHPTQLYSTVALLLIALFLSVLYWRRTRDGQVILTLFLIEPPTRWAIELLRADNPVDTAGLTISQFLAICLMAFALLGLFALRYLPRRSPRAVPWVPPEPPAPTAAKKAAR